MYNLTWLFKNKRDFVDLVKLSQRTKNEKIFATDLYVNLVEHFWDQYYYKLFKYQFLPYMLYAISCTTAIYLGLKPRTDMFDEDNTMTRNSHLIASSAALCSWSYGIYSEIV